MLLCGAATLDPGLPTFLPRGAWKPGRIRRVDERLRIGRMVVECVELNVASCSAILAAPDTRLAMLQSSPPCKRGSDLVGVAGIIKCSTAKCDNCLLRADLTTTSVTHPPSDPRHY
jgi:hypothetical protein